MIHFNFLCAILCWLATSISTQESDTLQLVHVLFRHGNRSVDINTIYPNDPYINETYYPFGLGQLTNKGKQTAYHLGKELRQKYNSFLGNVYTPDILDPLSSYYNRTKMSMELTLAGLFPPRNTLLEWERDLNWQPIPYNYLETQNPLLGLAIVNCPRYKILLDKYFKSPAGIARLMPYQSLFEYLTKHTGLNVTTNKEVLLIYSALEAEEDWGFALPDWTKPIYPHKLEVATGDFYVMATSTPELRQLAGGFLLHKIIDDSRAKINKVLVPKTRKLFLYSAHDMTIGFLLGAMKVMYPHQPPYGSYIAIELHKINRVYGFKIYYQSYRGDGPVLITIPGCTRFCPFDKFIRLLENSLPVGGNPCGDETHLLNLSAEEVKSLGFHL